MDENGVDLIRIERERQVSEEGWTSEHDDEHGDGTLAVAAARYAEVAGRPWSGETGVPGGRTPRGWPWDAKWWKPSGDRIRDLVKAGALIAAEIDRLQRAKGPS